MRIFSSLLKRPIRQKKNSLKQQTHQPQSTELKPKLSFDLCQVNPIDGFDNKVTIEEMVCQEIPKKTPNEQKMAVSLKNLMPDFINHVSLTLENHEHPPQQAFLESGLPRDPAPQTAPLDYLTFPQTKIPENIKTKPSSRQKWEQRLFFPQHQVGAGIVQKKLPGTANLSTLQPVDLIFGLGVNMGTPVLSAISLADLPIHATRLHRLNTLRSFWKKEIIRLLEESSPELVQKVKTNDPRHLIDETSLRSIAFDFNGNYSEKIKMEALDLLLAVNRRAQFYYTKKNALANLGVSVLQTVGTATMTAGSYLSFGVMAGIGSLAWGAASANPVDQVISVKQQGRTRLGYELEKSAISHMISNNTAFNPKNIKDAYEYALDEVHESSKTVCCIPIRRFKHTYSYESRNSDWRELSKHVVDKILATISEEARTLDGGFQEMLMQLGNRDFQSIKKVGQYLYTLGGQTVDAGDDFARNVIAKLALIERVANEQKISFPEADDLISQVTTAENIPGKRGLIGSMNDYVWGQVLSKRY